MASSLDEAYLRTSLSQTNQMEMLTFRLTDRQLYGINVFKIIEIFECPKSIDRMPHSHPAVKGAINFRGSAIAAIDLSEAVGLPSKEYKEELAYIVICEYNRQQIAFIIQSPDTLLTRSWQDIHKPEGVKSKSLVAIAYGDNGETIMLLDIETILADTVGIRDELSQAGAVEAQDDAEDHHLLLVDDSKTALLMLKTMLERMRIRHTSFDSAELALEFLRKGTSPVDLIISDIEMPGMDGFTFCRKIREDANLRGSKVILHSSMSNPSNKLMAEQAGADRFIPKFDADNLSKEITEFLAAG